MEKTLTARAAILIKRPAVAIWEALTKPDMIKRYFFGADVISDWKVGGSIIYRGQWDGRVYEDKGTVLKVEPARLLVVTHWSPLSAVPDVPENYHTVTYILSSQADGTQVTITQDNNATEEEQVHSEKNWNMVLAALKELLET